MIEQVLKGKNIQKAIKQTVSNKGACGVDFMPVDKLKEYIENHNTELFMDIIQKRYNPNAIKGVYITKDNGSKRLLGIPTVTDRMLQQAVSQVVAPHFELTFKDSSYGFRPNRNAQQAILQAQKYIHEGYKHIVDIDLQNFFDEVEHSILLDRIYKKVKCPITLRLIRKWLRAPILIEGKLTKRRKGIPQGSPISPLLSNIMLHDLDEFLESKQQKYVRYADDFSIYTKGKQRAKEIGNQVYLFLNNKLKLPINRAKSGIHRPSSFTILGYGFTSAYEKNVTGKYQLVVSEKSWKKLKAELKEITRKTSPMSFEMRMQKLKQVQRGWLNYFRLANITSKLQRVDSWLRNRIRYCIWHDWKKPERKRKNLIQLGVPYGKAYAYSRTRKGGWAIAQSPILQTTITLERLRKRGYESMEVYYQK
jgi:RNA-directed DNA polymerase